MKNKLLSTAIHLSVMILITLTLLIFSFIKTNEAEKRAAEAATDSKRLSIEISKLKKELLICQGNQ